MIMYTDNESWTGRWGYWGTVVTTGHTFEEIAKYRREVSPAARFMIAAMTATPGSQAPPDDPFCMELVGMDSSTPGIVAEFLAGRL